MKKLLSLAFVALLGASMLSASEIATKQGVNGLQSQEVEFLFGANTQASDINVAVLSDEEMKETQGQFWGAFWATVVVETIDRIGENNGWW